MACAYITHILQDKKSLTLSSDDHLHLEGFALNVFAKADKQDRAGRADMYVSMYRANGYWGVFCGSSLFLFPYLELMFNVYSVVAHK